MFNGYFGRFGGFFGADGFTRETPIDRVWRRTWFVRCGVAAKDDFARQANQPAVEAGIAEGEPGET
jgi:hypothetical protein